VQTSVSSTEHDAGYAGTRHIVAAAIAVQLDAPPIPQRKPRIFRRAVAA